MQIPVLDGMGGVSPKGAVKSRLIPKAAEITSDSVSTCVFFLFIKYKA